MPVNLQHGAWPIDSGGRKLLRKPPLSALLAEKHTWRIAAVQRQGYKLKPLTLFGHSKTLYASFSRWAFNLAHPAIG
jgi:hypothetical protein